MLARAVARNSNPACDRFVANRPDRLWVSDFIFVSTWQGIIYVAFVIDDFAGKIVGRRVSPSMTTVLAPDALLSTTTSGISGAAQAPCRLRACHTGKQAFQ